VLRANSPATHLVQRIRDEAHRFAITFHRMLSGKAMLASKLDQIIGVGEIKRNRLLKQFGSLDKIEAASDEDLQKVGINLDTAREIRKVLR